MGATCHHDGTVLLSDDGTALFDVTLPAVPSAHVRTSTGAHAAAVVASASGTTATGSPDSTVAGAGFPWCRVVDGASRLCSVEAAEFALCYASAGTSTVTKAGTIAVRAAPQARGFSTTPASTAIQVAAATVASLPSEFAPSLSAALVAAPNVPTARSPFVLRVEGAGLAANDRLKIIDAPGSCEGADANSSPAMFQLR